MTRSTSHPASARPPLPHATVVLPTSPDPPGRTLTEDQWWAAARAHRSRVGRITGPHRERRRRGEAHPVWDFLFTYYSLRPAILERWTPGPGVLLRGVPTGDPAEDVLTVLTTRPGHVVITAPDGEPGVVLDPTTLPPRVRQQAVAIAHLLRATASRPPRLSCFGLHEWAMVYRGGTQQDEDPRRHRAVPLRLGAEGTDAVVESLPVTCTHFDAFRFFTAPARPRNAHTPTRETQADLEQPGCLHATMDLYKWAYQLLPATPADLLADCLELAADVRELDMRASPYDLRAHGYSPVPIETPAGRAAYARAQVEFSHRATPLRSRLIDLAELVAAA